MSVNPITDENFPEIVEKFSTENPEAVILIDFWATWCGPCKILAPVIAKLQDNLTDDSVKILSAEMQEAGTVFNQYTIKSVPTLLYIKNNKEVARSVGIKTQKEIEEQINTLKA